MKIKKIGILNENNLKEALKDVGKPCFCSDLARVTGVSVDNNGFGEYWINGKETSDKKNRKNTNYIGSNGALHKTYKGEYKSGVRLAISFDDIEDINSEELENFSIEYPITNIGGRTAETIEKLFETRSKLIIKTGKKYYVCGKLYDELEVFGIRFIKMPHDSNNVLLSDGTYSNKSKEVFLRVDSIPLMVSESERILYSPNILFGSTFDKDCKDFSNSELNKELNGDFLKSLNGEFNLENEASILFGDNMPNESNRYGFSFAPLSEEEIMEICINSNISVFLHGKTGAGKTERVVALDNNLELVDFGCTSSDGFTGIIAKDYNSKELVLYEPYWFKNISRKCKEEPDYLHILFLEELLNAKNDVQKVAFEVTLNKTLTNSGFRLKLPENCVVVAAGNEASESKSANAMSAPLFGRFAHIYIDTSSEEWLKWALKRKKEGKRLIYRKIEERDTIHPAIIDFIRINGDKALRTPYNGVTPNADPRKWALASKALYQCNNPQVLRAFVGNELTQDFIKFCQMNLVSVKDVLNGKCRSEDVSSDPSVRWYSTVCLSTVDDENFDTVREFVRGLGSEFLAVFDYEWSKGNDERVMRLYNESINSHNKRLTLNGNNNQDNK